MKKTALIRTALFIGCLFLSQLVYAQTVGTKAFEVTITGKGEPMLFIPGAASSREVWKETVYKGIGSFRLSAAICKTCGVQVSLSSKHFVMYDAPDWFYQEIDTFIKAS